MSAFNKMKKNEVYHVVVSWVVNREDGQWYPSRIEKVVALTGGAKAPKVATILENGELSEHWKFYFDGFNGERSVYATREEAEGAV